VYLAPLSQVPEPLFVYIMNHDRRVHAGRVNTEKTNTESIDIRENKLRVRSTERIQENQDDVGRWENLYATRVTRTYHISYKVVPISKKCYVY
jgi:hypothetical protein